MEKICGNCKLPKNINEFYKNKATKDGLNCFCKICSKIKIEEWKINNIERIKKYSEEYYQNNKENYKKRLKKWSSKNKERQIELVKKNYEKEKLLGNKKRKEWLENNPNYHHDYFQRNKERIKPIRNKNRKEYRKNISVKIRLNLSTRIGTVLKRNKLYKTNTTLKLIGCNLIELKQYLEKLFIKGMSWDNYGIVWEIDHIKPCYGFDLTDYNEQLKCFHFTNLQPLFKTTRIAEQFGHFDQIGNRNKWRKIN